MKELLEEKCLVLFIIIFFPPNLIEHSHYLIIIIDMAISMHLMEDHIFGTP
jgi:hypothetical protein